MTLNCQKDNNFGHMFNIKPIMPIMPFFSLFHNFMIIICPKSKITFARIYITLHNTEVYSIPITLALVWFVWALCWLSLEGLRQIVANLFILVTSKLVLHNIIVWLCLLYTK